MINYSIIIPHKNIPVLLQRCLDSIPKREDIQIIVVDDNSDPEIVDFDRFPGNEDERLEIIFTKEGKGAGYARNVGLKKARGRWLLFADADDFFSNRFLSLVDLYKDADADIIFFDSDGVHSDTLKPVGPRIASMKRYVLEKNEEGLRYEYPVPWGKMFDRSFVMLHGFTFDETTVANDVMFSLYTGYCAQKINVCPEILYYSTERDNSLWHGATSDSLLTRIAVACRYNRFLRKHGLINRHRFYVYGFVHSCRAFGVCVYLKALILYFRNEQIKYICVDFLRLIKVKIKK